ncbi:hypothetical protein [Longimicrobium sp.]|uniref:hypothetical protein n=1 Tax=Longimicrobium sp. TaxID=2029185 RepID=UPI003B3B2708
MRVRIMRWRLLILLLACVAAAAPGRAAGQDPDSARAVLGRPGLCPGAHVQISTTFGERFRGVCVLQDARLLVVRGDSAQPVLYTAVDSIWMRAPATRSGTITGAWVGAGVGGALGALYIAVFCDYACGDDVRAHTLGGAVGGGLAGALVGRLIGGEVRVWRRLYPR